MEKTIKGIRIIEKKWSLIWLNDPEKQTTETMDYFDFKAILHQTFTEEQVNKILEIINCDEKVLIDFDKEKVKLITIKDKPFTDQMKEYMNPNRVLLDLMDSEESVGTFIKY